TLLFALFSLILFGSTLSHAETIGLLSAMPEELEDLKAQITNKQEVEQGIIKGNIGSHTIYATLSGIGKVNASATAQKLISEFKVRILLFSGVAGGINPDYNVGDVILASQAFQHDVGHWGQEFTMHAAGSLPEIGIGTGKESPFLDLNAFWQPDVLSNIKNQAIDFSKSFRAVRVNNKDYLPALKVDGIVATGDQFIANDAKKKYLRSKKSDVVEMEGAAVAQVALKNRIPCMIIRAVSDKAGEDANINFQVFFATVAKNNADLVVHLLKYIP
ncbi:MAG: 5'-methylthioadenosine/adenosylhomocysteine nucleosidase, partial [Desulforhopalus sp.]